MIFPTCFSSFPSDQVPPGGRGELYLLQGRALNAAPDHSAAAEDALGRATRFNLPDAWNELGECQYKKGDFNSALTCFQKALKLVGTGRVKQGRMCKEGMRMCGCVRVVGCGGCGFMWWCYGVCVEV